MRGYVRTRFTAGELRADFRILPFVRTPGAPVATAASFAVEDRVPTLHPA
jgi:alkaline phosphatase D